MWQCAQHPSAEEQREQLADFFDRPARAARGTDTDVGDACGTRGCAVEIGVTDVERCLRCDAGALEAGEQ